MDTLNNIDPNANPSTHSTITFIYNTFATKMPVLLVLLITHTSGLLMCKFLFAIWKSLILMTQMPSPSTHSTESLIFIHWLRSYLNCTSGAT
jgi:hypothetical protein